MDFSVGIDDLDCPVVIVHNDRFTGRCNHTLDDRPAEELNAVHGSIRIVNHDNVAALRRIADVADDQPILIG